MTKQDAIKYLQQLYPNCGHCWLDEQRIEAIGMAIKALQEEPVSEELEDITQTITYKGEVYTRCYKDKLDEFACKYPMSVPKSSKRYAKFSDVDLTIAVKEGAKWQKEQIMAKAEKVEISCASFAPLSSGNYRAGDKLLIIKEE